MLALHARTGEIREPPSDLARATLSPEVVWVDLLQPSAGEIGFVERATGLHVPGFDELREIETSSRLRAESGALYLSAPLVQRADADVPQTTPVGFLLTRERLVTIRFEMLTAFTSFAKAAPASASASASEAFAGLIEAIVDRLADILEGIAAELDTLSHWLFRSGPTEANRTQRPARYSADLRRILRRIGRSGDLASKIRDSLLGMSRIVPYVASMAAPWLPASVKHRLETIRHDIASLSDYEGHLANKVQLLLDATLGLINVEQNNIIKVLTIVSVVGIPPTLVASLYGMNFRYMPELEWTWGYPWGLALIALSALAPLVWFKLRGWF